MFSVTCLLKDASGPYASASSTKTSLWRRILLATAIVILVDFHYRLYRLIRSEQEPGKPGDDGRPGDFEACS